MPEFVFRRPSFWCRVKVGKKEQFSFEVAHARDAHNPVFLGRKQLTASLTKVRFQNILLCVCRSLLLPYRCYAQVQLVSDGAVEFSRPYSDGAQSLIVTIDPDHPCRYCQYPDHPCRYCESADLTRDPPGAPDRIALNSNGLQPVECFA